MGQYGHKGGSKKKAKPTGLADALSGMSETLEKQRKTIAKTKPKSKTSARQRTGKATKSRKTRTGTGGKYERVIKDRGFFKDANSDTGWSYSNARGGIKEGAIAPQYNNRVLTDEGRMSLAEALIGGGAPVINIARPPQPLAHFDQFQPSGPVPYGPGMKQNALGHWKPVDEPLYDVGFGVRDYLDDALQVTQFNPLSITPAGAAVFGGSAALRRFL